MTVGVTRQAVSVLEGELLQFCLKILEGEVQKEPLVVAVSSFNGTAFGKNFKYTHVCDYVAQPIFITHFPVSQS